LPAVRHHRRRAPNITSRQIKIFHTEWKGKMLLSEQLAKDRVETMLKEAKQSRLAARFAALRRARRRADRAAARLRSAKHDISRLRSSMHADL
jgi:hypothetical protein